MKIKRSEFDEALKFFDGFAYSSKFYICPIDGEPISREACIDCYNDALYDLHMHPDHECLSCKLRPDIKAIPKMRGDVLKKALKTINGDRQDAYGAPENSFALIGEFWSTYLKEQLMLTISARQVSEMMMLFKIARMKGQKSTADNYVDCAGYCGIAADMLDG